jgi:MFS transporter, PPP family, 3-phenylpropionic acid transporter
MPRFLLLYALVYAAYGIEGPFMPALFAERGMSAEAIGLILAGGTVARLVAAPFAAFVADRLGAPRLLLAGALLCSALIGCGFGLAGGFLGLLLVSVLVSMALAPVNPLADALTAARPGVRYGVVRGAGSAAFIGGAMLAGPLVATAGLPAIIWVNAGLLVLGACAVLGLPQASAGIGTVRMPRQKALPGPGALRALLGLKPFRRLLLVTGLVQGSHALYGAFATLHWQAAGIPAGAIGLLWSVAVASEVLVFLFVGPRLLDRFGPGGLAVLAAAAGVLRWAVMASTAALPVQFLLQPLHGLTFAALHLATMRILADTVPPRLAATAFGVQSSLGPGLAGAVLMLVAGPLYGSFGAGGFWAMAVLCACALPAAVALAERTPAVREEAPTSGLLPAAVPIV